MMWTELRVGDVGRHGAPDANTPNIDRLAREGVTLTDTDFYENFADCSPTRSAFTPLACEDDHVDRSSHPKTL